MTHSGPPNAADLAALRAVRVCLSLVVAGELGPQHSAEIANPRALTSGNSGAAAGILARHSDGMTALLSILSAYSTLGASDAVGSLEDAVKTSASLHEHLIAEFEYDARLVTQGIPFEGGSRFSNGMGFAYDSRRLLNSPIWDEDLPDKDANSMAFARDAGHFLRSNPWKFWSEWHKAFLIGKPLDWKLQRRVALIGNAVWDAGPEAVAAEIERIRTEFSAPPSGKERFPKHEPKSVRHLIENRIIASASLQGLAAQVTQSIERFHAETGANALPEALEPLAALPALLLAVNSTIQDAPSDRAVASETEDQLRAEIGRLNAKVAQLENELQKASAAKPSVFSDAFKKQLGTSLGDWKLYAALCTSLWFVSGDEEGTQRRLENISHYRDMIFGEVSSPSDAAPARSTAAVESTTEI